MFSHSNFCTNVNNAFRDCYDSLNDANFVLNIYNFNIILMVPNTGISSKFIWFYVYLYVTQSYRTQRINDIAIN